MLRNRICLKFTTAGLHQPGVEWPKSIVCLHALNMTSISSEKEKLHRKAFRTVFPAQSIKPQVFLLPKNNTFLY